MGTAKFVAVMSLAALAGAYATGWKEPVKLNANVNFGGLQRGTSIAPDGNTLYFSSHFNQNMDIYRSRYVRGDWGPAEKIAPGNVSTEAFENDPYIHRDSKTLYFVTNRDGSEDIWYSVYNGGWSTAAPIPGAVNTGEYDEFNLRITPDGRTMYFSSNRPGVPGYWSIWASSWTGSAWSEPQPLGSAINAGPADYAPKLTSDGRFMYFNSRRWGDNDLYFASRVGESWGNVTRLPYPVNSEFPEFDASVFTDGDVGTLYFVSRRGGRYEIWASEFEGLSVVPTSLGRIKAVFE